MSSPYPFTSHHLDLGGHQYHYVDEGKGDPVVMVHGNPTWSFYFRNLILALRDTHRVIAPDHIGCGRSDKPPTSQYAYTLKKRIDDLEALLESLGIQQNVTLVLHDWGGMIGMGYAVRHPERIKRLVILNTAAFHLPATKRFPWPLWLGRNTHLGAFLILRLNAFCRVAARVCCKRGPLSAEVKQLYLEPYNSVENRVAVLRFVQDIPLKDGDPSYGAVTEIQDGLEQFRTLPILICWGERDFVFSLEFLDEWLRRFPNAEVHRFPDAGHYVLEDACSEIVELVRGFMGVGSGGGSQGGG